MLGHCSTVPLQVTTARTSTSPVVLSCGFAGLIWVTQRCPCHPRPRGTCSRDTSSGRHGNFLPEQQALYFSPVPVPANFLSLGSFQLIGPAPSAAQGCSQQSTDPTCLGRSLGPAQPTSPILQGAFSLPCMPQGADCILCMSSHASVFLKVLETFSSR